MIIFNALHTSLNGGIGRYSYELAKRLYISNKVNIKIVIREEDLKLFRFVEDSDLIVVNGINNSIKRNIYEQLKLPRLIYKNYPDAIIHYPDSMAPLLGRNKIVITIHDLAFNSLKKIFTIKSVLWKKIITKLSIKKADKIICITNFAKSEVVNYYTNIDQDKIDVIYNGVTAFNKENIDLSKISNNIKIYTKEKYIFTVSTISPRKNLDRLIKAFYKIKDKIDVKLIISGANGWMYEEVYKIVEELKISDRVVFTGKVNDEELKYLYKNAEIFIFPSVYEGFGLPPLEAMNYKIPIIASNVTSLPEILGDLVVYCDPYSIKDISDKIIKVFNGEELCKTDMYKSRLENFTWEKCANEVNNLYENLENK